MTDVMEGVEEWSWSEFMREWEWNAGEHVSIFGQTGCGKSYLCAKGLLKRIPSKRSLIIDVKGDDPTWNGIGRSVDRIPRFSFLRSKGPEHYRLIVSDSRDEARTQVARALQRVYKEGNWTVFLDETRALSDPKPPNLNLQPLLDRMWLRGRSRGITVVAGTQAPRYVPSSMYDQATHLFIGRILDHRVRLRLREIVGQWKQTGEEVASLPKHWWLYVGDYGDWTIKTKVGTK